MVLAISSFSYICIGVITGVGLLILLGRIIAAQINIRKTARKMIKTGFDFEHDVNTEKNILFFCHKGKRISIDFAGDDVFEPYFANEQGEKVDILPQINCEVFIDKLLPTSVLPDKAYRVMVRKTLLKQDDAGAAHPLTLLIHFCPAQNDIRVWTIIDDIYKRDCFYNKVRMFVLKNPLLGTLYLPVKQLKKAKKGDKISLISKVEEVGEAFRLSYVQA